MNDEEVRLKAKDLGIKSWHVKKIDNLKIEIENFGKEIEEPAALSALEKYAKHHGYDKAELSGKTVVMLYSGIDVVNWVSIKDVEKFNE